MDNGWAVILGGAVGVIGTWGTTWLNHYYERSQKNESEESAKALLKELLEVPEYKWRKIDTLANVVGTNQATVRRLLLEIGGRGSVKNGSLWGLISRNPIKKAQGDASEDPWAPGEAHVAP